MVEFHENGTLVPNSARRFVLVGLNIKNSDVERLAAEVSDITGESKTEAIRKALELRRAQLELRRTTPSRAKRLQLFLERQVWPHVPEAVSNKPLTKQEEEDILGYGPRGV
jgi:antitoxin VapB